MRKHSGQPGRPDRGERVASAYSGTCGVHGLQSNNRGEEGPRMSLIHSVR